MSSNRSLVHRTARPLRHAVLALLALLVAAGATAAEPGDAGAAAAGGQGTVLITGANRGIGFEFVRQYAAKGYRVIATCRNPDDADALQDLARDNENIVVERLDLMDLDGIDALALRYQDQPVDVLINNAALMRGPDPEQTFGSFDYAEFDRSSTPTSAAR
jgi:NADPH:quinone reductase-like Zn-dependent oxidoreductase